MSFMKNFIDYFVYVTLARNIANSININPNHSHDSSSLKYSIVSNSLIIAYFYFRK